MKQFWLFICAGLLLLSACAIAPKDATGLAADPAASAAPAGAQPVPGPVQHPEELAAALDNTIRYGPGEAGVSLKTAIAAAGLLDWAEDYAPASGISSITGEVEAWLARQAPEDQALFWENWPAVDDTAQTIARDISACLDLLEDAGHPQTHDAYVPAKYQRLHCGVEGALRSA